MTVKKAVIIGLLLEILIGCLAGVFYFKFYIYTPTYSIRAMQKAMQSGDVKELKNRVDLDGLFKLNNGKLAQLVDKNDPAYGKIADGSFASYCQEDFLNYVQNGKWQDREKITPESALEDRIGFRSVSFRSLDYIYRDPPPGQENVKEQSITDKMLSMGISLLNKYVLGHERDEENVHEETKAAQEAATDTIVTAGVRVYEPNLGDTFVLKLKLRRQEDGSWKLYDIENYQEYAELLLKQNDRDFIRYKEKVRSILTSTQEKLDELREAHPERDMDWMIEARKIMKESDQQLEELKVPVAGGYLNQLIKERKDLFYELMDSYYDLASQTQDMNTAKEKAKEPVPKKQRRPVYNEAVWNGRLAKSKEKINEAQKKWADNKAKLEAVVGPVIDRAAVAQTTAKSLRNKDDALVRAANYPVGGSQNNGADVDSIPSLLDSDKVPTVSAYKG